MQNNPNNDPSTPENNPASGQQPELSLADQILAMKAERDARMKAWQEAQNQLPGSTPAPASGQAEQKTAPAAQEANKVVPEPGAPEASGPSETAPAAVNQKAVQAAETETKASENQPEPKEIISDPSPSVTEEIQEGKVETDLIAADAVDQPNVNTTEKAQAPDPVVNETEPVTSSAPEEKPLSILGEVELTDSMNTPDPEAHADEHEEHEEVEETDYSSFTKSQLASEIKKITSEADGAKNGRKVTQLYRLYQQQVKVERIESLNRFTEGGGEEADFVYTQTPEDAAVEKAVVQFREQKSRQAKLQEEVKAKNLQSKKEILEKLRQLVDRPEENQNSINELKQIQADWKAIGAVPQGESQELWSSYHALLDQYYNNRSIFNELKDLDRKRNLEAKVTLCERAEALDKEESINNALIELRHLHEEWKNIGPVPADSRDTIWDRFIAASEKVHERKKAYLTERKAKEESNLLSKLDVLKMMDEFGGFVTDRINDWRSKTDEVQKIKDIWEKIGLVPKEKAEEINKKFWGAYKAFFHNKNAFFKALDDQKMENLRLKTEMCEYAENLVDNPDYHGTKEKLIQLQKKWKTIGRVPDKNSDEVWNRFRAACNAFFDKKNAEVAAAEAEKERRETERRTFVNDFEQRLTTGEEVTEQGLETILAQWRELNGNDDKTSQKTSEKFYQLAEQYIAKMPGLTDEERQDKLFQMEVASLKAHPDNNQDLYKKEQSLRKEIQTLEHAIATLKTNMDFFAKSKNADQIRNDYSQRINESQQKIDELKRRLKLLKK